MPRHASQPRPHACAHLLRPALQHTARPTCPLQVWQYVAGDRPALSRQEFYTAMKLVSLAQLNGGVLDDAQALRLVNGLGGAVPLPRMAGMGVPRGIDLPAHLLPAAAPGAPGAPPPAAARLARRRRAGGTAEPGAARAGHAPCVSVGGAAASGRWRVPAAVGGAGGCLPDRFLTAGH